MKDGCFGVALDIFLILLGILFLITHWNEIVNFITGIHLFG